MNLTITPIKTPAFNGAQKFKAIRNIPNLSCACCGDKVILRQDVVKAYKAVAKPLLLMIEQGFFNFISKKMPEVMEILNQWAKENPKTSLDIIASDEEKYSILRESVTKNVKNIPAIVERGDREVGRVSSIFFDDLFSRSRTKLKGSGPVIKRFMVFKPFLKGTKQEVFEQLEIYSRKYPRKTLSEIVNTEEIYKFHIAKDRLQRAETREKLDYHFDNVGMILKKTKAFTEDEIYNLRQSAIDTITHGRDPEARQVKMRDLYENALKEKNLEKLKLKIFDELKQVPRTFITKDSFIAYAHNHNYTDAQILESLLIPSYSSFEHIVPKAANGKDIQDNGIVLCADCNEKRKHIPYTEFLRYHPRMPYNTQKQIDTIVNLILTSKLQGPFRFWPIRVAKTLYDYSEGLINPDITKYCKKELLKSKARKEANIENFEKLKKQRTTKIQERLQTQEELSKIDSELTQINNNVKITNSINHYEDGLINVINEHLKNHK